MKINWQHEWKAAAILAGTFVLCFWLPVDQPRFVSGVTEALHLVRWYAREHVLLCLVPAFFIAGAIGVFVSQAAVMKYLGPRARKPIAYGVASVSGTILAVCSCTVLPLFAGIYRMGAGLGPATAFLYSGPAINVLAIVLTARILGLEMGVARALGAVLFSIVVGLLMHLVFRREERERAAAEPAMPDAPASRPLWQTALYFATMVGILVFANWGEPGQAGGFWHAVHGAKWLITGTLALVLAVMMISWLGLPRWHVLAAAASTALLALLFPHEPMIPFAAGTVGLAIITSRSPGGAGDWFAASWGFAKQIMPLLLLGVIAAGFFLGRPGHEGVIPSVWVARLVGGNSLGANFFASVIGAFMYFATLTEVPILQGLIGAGMGKGPALALLLAGPALSLPSMLVIRSIMGTKKTAVFVLLVIVMATIAGMLFGALTCEATK